jgi:hypothetical protein
MAKKATKKKPTRKKVVAKKVVKKAAKKKTAKKVVKKKVAKKATKKKVAKKKTVKKVVKKVAKKSAKKPTAKKAPAKKKTVKKKPVVKKVTKKPAVKKKVAKVAEVAVVKKKSSAKTKAMIPPRPGDDADMPRPRKRRSRKKKREMYFTQDTEDAIVLYNETECQRIRDRIYRDRIQYAFDKLAENIFNTFKFSYFDVAPTEVQKQVVSFLVSNIHKYKSQANGGSKAFSYFSVVAKHWLILQNNNTWKHWVRHTEIMDEPDEDTHGQILMAYDNENQEVQEFVELMIAFWEHNLNRVFNKPRELEIANSVIELFRNRLMLDFFNKKTLYLYIREMSGCKTQHITKVINKMKEYQKEISKQYIRSGVIDMDFSLTPSKEKVIKI